MGMTVKELVEGNFSTADIYEIRNVKSTGIFYYDPDRLIKDFGGHLIDDFMMIQGITGHDAVVRIFLKTSKQQ